MSHAVGRQAASSKGEQKKAEVLQLLMLQPVLAVLDETDSGLDVDALRTVAEGVDAYRCKRNAVLVITHYPRLLTHLRPDRVHVLMAGRIVHEGGPELAHEIEETLFERFTRAGVARDRVAGTGLGLAIARAYARAHSGDLRYEPGQPSGARFVVDLPSA